MRIIKYALGIAVITAAVFAVTNRTAEATSGSCKIEAATPVTVQDHGKNFTINNGMVTAKFKVTGDANCKKYAVLAVWNSPTANGLPLEAQTFYDYAPKTATAYPASSNTYSITVKLPTCTYYQLDLLEGTDPKGINGTAVYGSLMDPLSPDNASRPGYRRNIIDTKMGGNKCQPQPPTDVCLNIQGIQTQIPTGYKRDANGNCIIIPKDEDVCINIDQMQQEVPTGYTRDANGNCSIIPTVQQPQVQGKETPTALPSTGAGAIATTFFGVSTLGTLAHSLFRRFRR